MAALTTTMASAAKNSFAGGSREGQEGAGPEAEVTELTGFVARANGLK
jgi:hypothetical protein